MTDNLLISKHLYDRLGILYWAIPCLYSSNLSSLSWWCISILQRNILCTSGAIMPSWQFFPLLLHLKHFLKLDIHHIEQPFMKVFLLKFFQLIRSLQQANSNKEQSRHSMNWICRNSINSSVNMFFLFPKQG